jgi:hypothetical protein
MTSEMKPASSELRGYWACACSLGRRRVAARL